MKHSENIIIETVKDSNSISRFVFDIYTEVFGKLYGWQGDYNLDIRINDILYKEQSVILLIRPCDDFDPQYILGTIRAIYKNNNKLPIEKEFRIDIARILRDEKYKPNEVVEIARFATNHKLSQELHISPPSTVPYTLLKEMCLLIKKEKVKFLFASLDERVLSWLKRIGFNWQTIGVMKFHIGSPTVPVILRASEMEANLKRFNPRLYRYI